MDPFVRKALMWTAIAVGVITVFAGGVALGLTLSGALSCLFAAGLAGATSWLQKKYPQKVPKPFWLWAILSLVALALIYGMYPGHTVDTVEMRLKQLDTQTFATPEEKEEARAGIQADIGAETPYWFWLLWSGLLAGGLVAMVPYNEKGLAATWVLLFAWSWVMFLLFNHWLASVIGQLAFTLLPVAGITWLLVDKRYIRRIPEKQMVGVFFFTRRFHTKLNSLEETQPDSFLELDQRDKYRCRKGHFDMDIAAAIWPFRLVEWPATQVRLDYRGTRTITHGPFPKKDATGRIIGRDDGGREVETEADGAVYFQWTPDFDRALLRMAEGLMTRPRSEEEDEPKVDSVDPANLDGSLARYSENEFRQALRNEVAERWSWQGRRHVNHHLGEVTEGIELRVAQTGSPFEALGIVKLVSEQQPDGTVVERVVDGPCARNVRFVIEEFRPAPGSEFEKALGALLVGELRGEQQAAETMARGTAEAKMAAMRIKQAAAADRTGLAKQVEAAQAAGIPAEKALEEWTNREFGRAGGTTLVRIVGAPPVVVGTPQQPAPPPSQPPAGSGGTT